MSATSILRSFLALFLWVLLSLASQAQKKKTAVSYFPSAQHWERQTPQALGLKADLIASAVAYARQNESKNPRSMEMSHYQSFGKEPYGFGIGPFA